MSKLIYLETDEEITDVIDKISKVDDKAVSLVVPRGSTLANSVVNLKLLEKRGKKMGKSVALVTNDKIAKNLASQIGLMVFASINDAKAGVEVEETEMEDVPTISPAADVGTPTAPTQNGRDSDQSIGESVGGVNVHQYDRGLEEAEAISEPPVEEPPPMMPIEETSGVIEAVKDAEEENPEAKENKEVKEDIEDKDKSDDYKLIKKPFDHRPKFSGHGRASDPVFEKMRFAKLRRKRIFIGIGIGVAVLAALGLMLVLPKAKAVISVVAEPFSTTADISVNKDAAAIDATTSTIPGKLVSKEDQLTKPFTASGQKNIGAKAKGKITVYNNWDQNPINLPAGTKFSAGGVEFASTAAVTVPGAQVGLSGGQFVITASGTADVSVEATSVGEQSNIGSSDFVITSIPKIQQAKIYGKSSAAMTGGTNQIVKIVTDKDISGAKESTEKELKGKITDGLKSEVTGSNKLLDSAIAASVTSSSASNKVGDQVDNFNYDAKMKIDAITFSEDDFKALLLQNAAGKLPGDKTIVANDSQSLKYDVASADIAKGTIALKGTFDGFVAAKYDVDALKNEIKGKTFKTATAKLTAHAGVLSADISATPNFLRIIPFISRRIDIEFNYGSTPLTTGGSSSTTGGSGGQQ